MAKPLQRSGLGSTGIRMPGVMLHGRHGRPQCTDPPNYKFVNTVMTSTPSLSQSQRVMISYSSRDSDFVDELVALLEERGVTPWVDKHGIKPGQKWHNELLKQLRECDVLVPVLSRPFLESDPCKMEVFIARSSGKRIVPIMYSPDLGYPELMQFPETKGLEDLFMFRLQDDAPSQGMALYLSREEALSRTCASIVSLPETFQPGLVYIAFLRTEVEFATRIADGLRDQGVKTWIATRDIPVGTNFMQEQIAAMMHAAALIIVLGEGIEESGYIRTELNLAKAQGIDLLPVLPNNLANNADARARLMTALRSRDHTLDLYQTHAYAFEGDINLLITQIHNDLPEATRIGEMTNNAVNRSGESRET